MRLLFTLTAASGIACASKAAKPAAAPAPATGPVAYAPVSSIDTTKPGTRSAFQRANDAAAAVATIVVRPDSLIVRVGQVVQPWVALTIDARDSAGQKVADFAPLMLVEDPAIVEQGPSGLVARRVGETKLVISPLSLDPSVRVRDVRATVLLRVVP